MSEIQTTSKTGGQKGVKAQRYDLLPKEGLDAIAELFGYGATKYADHNWRNRYEFSKSIAALERHTQEFKNGETYDYCPGDCPMVDDEICREHSRLEHLAAIGFHTLVLLTWLRRDGEGMDNEYDDRWPYTLERARLAKLEEEAEEPTPHARSYFPSMMVNFTEDGSAIFTADPAGSAGSAGSVAVAVESNQPILPFAPGSSHSIGDGVSVRAWSTPEEVPVERELSEGWTSIGYVDEAHKFEPFENILADLKPFQDRIDEEVATLAGLMAAPETVATSLDTIRLACGLPLDPPRFVAGRAGIEDRLNPLPLARRWVEDYDAEHGTPLFPRYTLDTLMFEPLPKIDLPTTAEPIFEQVQREEEWERGVSGLLQRWFNK